MAISVVQTAHNGGSFPLNFASNVTSGNTAFLIASAYTSAGASITSSAPTLSGSPVTGSALLLDNESPASANRVYVAVWMLPNVTGGVNGLGLTLAGQAGIPGVSGMEVSGLGTAPALDQSSHGGNALSTAVDSGTTGAITNSPEFIIGAATIFNGSAAGPSSPWTDIQASSNSWSGYQIAVSSGGTYDWAQTGAGGNGPWSAVVVTVALAAALPPAVPAPVLAVCRTEPVPGRGRGLIVSR